MRKPALSAALLVFLLAGVAVAWMPPIQNPNQAVFTATHIVIVAPGELSSYTVERTYRGDRTVGSKIDLPAFKLIAWDRKGEIPVAVENSPRILMFLRPRENDPGTLEITDNGVAFFFRDVTKIDELEAIAKKVIAQHREWTEARDLSRPQDRIRRLFPYLSHYDNRSCRRLTLEELAKLSPASGDYLAEQVLASSPFHSSGMLLDIRQLQSPMAHQAAITAIDRACARYKTYLDTHGLKESDLAALGDDAPWELGVDSHLICHGLEAINSFQDPADAPYIRGLVPFLVAGGFSLSVNECLFAMKRFPAPENVPLLIAIWQDQQSRHVPPLRTVFHVAIAGAMAVQKDQAVIPALLEMAETPSWRDDAWKALRDLTGNDFRTTEEWKAWYAAQPAAKAEATDKIAQ